MLCRSALEGENVTLQEKITAAAKLAATVTNSMTSEQVSAIETEHAALVRQINAHAAIVENQHAPALRNAGVDLSEYDGLPPARRALAMEKDAVAMHGAASLGYESDDFDRVGSPAAGIAEALFSRIAPSHKMSRAGAAFAGIGIADAARRSLASAGLYATGLSNGQAVTRALHSTSDFPNILGDLARRVALGAYESVPAALRRVARLATAQDFRARRHVQLSAGPDLELVPEAGEYTFGTFSESGESYSVATYGKIFSISRQALINDDLGVFATIPARLAQSAAATEAQLLADLLNKPPVLGDNKPVFHAAHGNLAATGSALSLTSLASARLAMRQQTGLAGELVSAAPRFLIVPAALETEAESLVATIAPARHEDVNAFASTLEVVCEPRLTDPKAWFLAADPAHLCGLEFAYLEGSTGPEIETRAGFEVDGTQMRVRLDVGAGWVDHRAFFKNPGA